MASDPSFKLERHPGMPFGKPLAVIVLDGWGEEVEDEYNAIGIAETPTMDSFKVDVILLQLQSHKRPQYLNNHSDMYNF